MSVEIERKFLVTGDYRSHVSESVRVTQGYLNSHPGRTVRVRLCDKSGYITVKGMASASGLARFEWEKGISWEDARALLKLCEPGVIDKMRHYIHSGNHRFEVDEFLGENSGLVLAEIELSSELEEFERPEWLGEEVTGDARYYNASLAQSPYNTWAQSDS